MTTSFKVVASSHEGRELVIEVKNPDTGVVFNQTILRAGSSADICIWDNHVFSSYEREIAKLAVLLPAAEPAPATVKEDGEYPQVVEASDPIAGEELPLLGTPAATAAITAAAVLDHQNTVSEIVATAQLSVPQIVDRLRDSNLTLKDPAPVDVEALGDAPSDPAEGTPGVDAEVVYPATALRAEIEPSSLVERAEDWVEGLFGFGRDDESNDKDEPAEPAESVAEAAPTVEAPEPAVVQPVVEEASAVETQVEVQPEAVAPTVDAPAPVAEVEAPVETELPVPAALLATEASPQVQVRDNDEWTYQAAQTEKPVS